MICNNCKMEITGTAYPINTGRRVQYICVKCYARGQLDSGLRLGERRRAITLARSKSKR